MKKVLVAVALTLTALHAPACGPYFDYTYIVAASPNRAFKLPELSMAHELGKIPDTIETPRTCSVLPEGVNLRDLCNIGPLTSQNAQWHDHLVDSATTADLTDLFVALTEAGVDRETATGICRNYFSVRAGFDENLTTWALKPVHIGLYETFDTLAQLPREFYLYLDGARAFHQEKYGEAAAAFDAILAMPPEERRYRTTWALFMIGRMAAMAQRYPELATAHPQIVTDPLPLFELTRQSAVEGFVDTHDVTAGTYYQEALLATDACDPVKELHALARYNLVSDQYTSWMLKRATMKIAGMEAIPPEVLTDRLSRSVLVAFAASHVDARSKLAERILEDLTSSGMELTPYESGRLAWTAYALGHFDEAKALLRRAPEDPYAIWTQSRLRLRSDDIKGAVKSLKSAAPLFERDESWERSEEVTSEDGYSPFNALQNEQAVLLLTRDRYVDALDLFLLGESWVDAAYVAEHVLTLDELLVFYRTCEKNQRYTKPHPEPLYENVYRQPPAWEPVRDEDVNDSPPPSELDRLRALVGRRMLREQRYAGAAELFPEDWRHLAEAFIKHRQAASTTKSDKERATHLVQAAQLLRHWGMELTGYESDPDFTYVDGQHLYQTTSALRAKPDAWLRFAAQTVAQNDYVYLNDAWRPKSFDEQWIKDLPHYISVVKPSNEERRRLQLNGPKLYRRWHYRFIAADLFKQAAGLLPDQTEEKAQALYYGGEVLKKVVRYQDAVARMSTFHRDLVKHCSTLQIAQDARQKGWFPDEPINWELRFSAKTINEAALATVSNKVAAAQ